MQYINGTPTAIAQYLIRQPPIHKNEVNAPVDYCQPPYLRQRDVVSTESTKLTLYISRLLCKGNPATLALAPILSAFRNDFKCVEVRLDSSG